MLVTIGSYTPPGAAQASSGVPAKPLTCDVHRGQAYHPGLQGSLSPAQGGRRGTGQGRSNSKASRGAGHSETSHASVVLCLPGCKVRPCAARMSSLGQGTLLG